ncbi:MAG: haloacid dehalogenase-like hydrolase [Flavobacteriaceae bacterium]
MKNKHIIFLAIVVLCVFSCKQKQENPPIQKDPLPSFNDVQSKANIMAFVQSVTDSTSSNYVKPIDRIACFDNDGTLWAEQPLPSQLFFVFDKVREMARSNPKYATESPYKQVVENNLEELLKQDKDKLVAMIGEVDSLFYPNYKETVNSWIDTVQHPVLNRPYASTVYQPMIELLDYLRANQFTVYVVSGGGVAFMRAWQPVIYGIPENNIIGSTFKTEAVQKNDSIAVVPTSQFDFYDDHMGKVINIQKTIGKKPIMVVGNSDGDLEMMEYAFTNNPHPTFMLYVNHTDGEREFLYDEKTIAGKLIKGKEVAKKNGWTIIDMRNDWKTVFPN